MVTGKTCGNCAAFSVLTNECRRKSPSAVTVQQPNGQLGAIGVYPATTKDKWCAEWLTDESASRQ